MKMNFSIIFEAVYVLKHNIGTGMLMLFATNFQLGIEIFSRNDYNKCIIQKTISIVFFVFRIL